MARRMANARLAIVPGLSLMGLVEEPGAINEILVPFLAGILEPRGSVECRSLAGQIEVGFWWTCIKFPYPHELLPERCGNEILCLQCWTKDIRVLGDGADNKGFLTRGHSPLGDSHSR
jgi:hypothetical protein